MGDRILKVEAGCMAAHVGWFRYSIDDLYGSDLLLFRIPPRVVLRERGVDLIGGNGHVRSTPSVVVHPRPRRTGSRILKERAQDGLSPIPQATVDALFDLVVGLHHEGRGYGGTSEELGGSVVEQAMFLIRENYADRSLTPVLARRATRGGVAAHASARLHCAGHRGGGFNDHPGPRRTCVRTAR